MVAEAAGQIQIDGHVLATLARAVTFPHWEYVSRAWLPEDDGLDEWRRFLCPTCGGTPGLAESRTEAGASDLLKGAARRFMHCAFCGCRWPVPGLTCPACSSTKAGSAKYLFTDDEPELRVDFCESCRNYIKVIDGDKVSGPIHVGLELLTTTHLDMLARDKNLSPLEVCA
jgi:FdhE protein